MVYFDEASIDAYLGRHGFGVVAETSTPSSTPRDDTDRHSSVQDVKGGERNPSSEVLRGTGLGWAV